MSYSESRAKYAATLNSVVDDREEFVVTRTGREPVVMVALGDLPASIERLEKGRGPQHELAE